MVVALAVHGSLALAAGTVAFAALGVADFVGLAHFARSTPIAGSVGTIAATAAIVLTRRAEARNRAAVCRAAGIVLAVAAGSVGVVAGFVGLGALVTIDVFDDLGKYELPVLAAATVSILAGTAAILGAGRATVRGESGAWVVLAAGLAALPLGWGLAALCSSLCLRRAGVDRVPRRTLDETASACAAAASAWTVVASLILLHRGSASWAPLTGTALGVAAAVLLARSRWLGALLALTAGAIWLELVVVPGAALIGYAAIPYLVAGTLGGIGLLRRHRTRWGRRSERSTGPALARAGQ